MTPDLSCWDDVVGDQPPDPEKLRDALEWLRENVKLPARERRGEYRNKFGDRVTWEATTDGSYVSVQTWPEASE